MSSRVPRMALFSTQVAVVTGASSGVGEAIALRLAMEGATLCLIGRNADRLAAVAEETRARSAPTRTYVVDFTVPDSVRDCVSQLRNDVAHVDILIHSAGTIARGRVETAAIEQFDRQYCINVRVPYYLTQCVLPLLRVRRGQIVFVNSSVVLAAKAEVGQYAATKQALLAIADSLREEVNADGLRVLSVFLGRTATPMQAALYELEGRRYYPELLLQADDVAAVVCHTLSLPRTAEVTEISMRPLLKSY
ncbi:MAG: SDR family NAD(P)-dependent oxidoreductase [Candidatus Binatia bacterium]